MAKTRSRKPSNQRRKAPAKKPVPGWIWLLGVTAFAAFAGFLYYLTSVPAAQPEAPKVAERKVTPRKPAETPAKVVAAPKPAPQLKKEDTRKKEETKKKEEEQARFKFYEMLPQTEVVPPVNEYQTDKNQDNFHYLLQTGSFRTEAEAEKQKALIAFQGMKGSIDQITTKDGTQWYRVNVGPFASRSNMNVAMDKLVAINIQPLIKKIKQDKKPAGQ